MSAADIEGFLAFTRKKTDEILEKIASDPDASKILGWRPGPGRAHIAWQLMHIGATDDRHLNVLMKGGEPVEPDYIKRFAGYSVPDDVVPSIDTIRSYLAARREAMLAHLRSLSDTALAGKPEGQTRTYLEWFRLLNWHEAHHQGQVHLTLNLYKATHPTG